MILIYLQKIIKMIIIQLLRINNLEKYVHSKYTIANKKKIYRLKQNDFLKFFFFEKLKRLIYYITFIKIFVIDRRNQINKSKKLIKIYI